MSLLFNQATQTYFREEDHTYWSSDLKQIPGVSTIIRYNEPNFVKSTGADIHGSNVHKALHIYDMTGEVQKGYEVETAIWVDFLDKEQYEVVKVELIVFNPSLWYIGTLDRILRHKPTGRLAIGDIKTGYLDREHGGKQLNAYRLASHEPIEELFLIGVNPKLNKKGWRKSVLALAEIPFMEKLYEYTVDQSGLRKPHGLRVNTMYQEDIHDN